MRNQPLVAPSVLLAQRLEHLHGRGRVRDRYVVVAVHLPSRARHGAAGRHPVEDLHALGTSERHQLVHRVVLQCFGVGNQGVQALLVEFAVDEARACAIELVREATGPEYDDALLALPVAQRLPDGPTERQAAARARQGMLDGVDRDRRGRLLSQRG